MLCASHTRLFPEVLRGFPSLGLCRLSTASWLGCFSPDTERSSTENRLKSFKYLDLNLFTETSRLQSNKHVWSRWHFLCRKLWHGEVHHAVWDSAKSYRTITHPTSHIEIALLAFQMCSIFCKLGAPQAYLTQVFEALLRQSIAHHLDMIIGLSK